MVEGAGQSQEPIPVNPPYPVDTSTMWDPCAELKRRRELLQAVTLQEPGSISEMADVQPEVYPVPTAEGVTGREPTQVVVLVFSDADMTP